MVGNWGKPNHNAKIVKREHYFIELTVMFE